MSTTNDSTTPGYEARCAAAATDQGLDPAVALLTAAGIDHRVAQTGGFCMVIEVPVGTDGAYVGVTRDDTDEGWLVMFYSAEAARGESDDWAWDAECATDDQMITVIRGRVGVHAPAWTARQCPDCEVWVYCDDGPFAEGDRTKTLADSLHYERFHTPTPVGDKAFGFPYFPWNDTAVAAVRPPAPAERCTGTEYPVNPDAPAEGTDVHHTGPCAAHEASDADADELETGALPGWMDDTDPESDPLLATLTENGVIGRP